MGQVTGVGPPLQQWQHSVPRLLGFAHLFVELHEQEPVLCGQRLTAAQPFQYLDRLLTRAAAGLQGQHRRPRRVRCDILGIGRRLICLLIQQADQRQRLAGALVVAADGQDHR